MNSGINFDAYEDIPVETIGQNVPPPVNTFLEIDLGKAVNQNIRRCKYVKPPPVQRHAMAIAHAGRDLMACAQTVSGKTAAFCFPIISGIMRVQFPRPPRSRVAFPLALILSLTRELSCQIHDEAKKFAYQTGVRVVVAYGPINQRVLSNLLFAWKIVQQMDMPPPGVRQTMLFRATFPREIQRLALDFLSNYIFLAVGRVGSSTDLIIQQVEYVQETDKRSHLMDLLHAQKANGAHGKLLPLFLLRRKRADSLEHWLCMNGFPATAIHGDRTQQEREYALRSFKSGNTPILVATDVAARGLDIPHVAHHVNFDIPNDIDDYVHRIGRTGQAGKSSLATTFFNENTFSVARALADSMQEANQKVPTTF
ncbi:DEAD-box ATP-dependent RNA helicase 37 [Capsicum annuum]|uniref:RNA helicase n=1 Tax=Capsicum annuum TaxID=4072 RepID=A0A2G2Z0S3_CAPAN|nr:DEAD-box ATP-dependent RNA helicase 37 [Capsicum annuum]PHT75617.1 DEAD-box ATP-dependent RNA helicase 37 [Capsicum annuum]